MQDLGWLLAQPGMATLWPLAEPYAGGEVAAAGHAGGDAKHWTEAGAEAGLELCAAMLQTVRDERCLI